MIYKKGTKVIMDHEKMRKDIDPVYGDEYWDPSFVDFVTKNPIGKIHEKVYYEEELHCNVYTVDFPNCWGHGNVKRFHIEEIFFYPVQKPIIFTPRRK